MDFERPTFQAARGEGYGRTTYQNVTRNMKRMPHFCVSGRSV